MALKPTKIKHKRSSIAGKKPIVSQLESGEIAINTADGKIFLLKDDNTVQDLTQKIFENNTKVEVNDPGDSQGTITATVDGSEKMIITNSTINVYEEVDMENATGITFRELTASGDDGITIKAPDNLPSSYTLNLPLTTGTFGQFIRTDGTGQLEFVNADIFGGNVIYVSAEQGDRLHWMELLGRRAAADLLTLGKVQPENMLEMTALPEHDFKEVVKIATDTAKKLNQMTIDAERELNLDTQYIS